MTTVTPQRRKDTPRPGRDSDWYQEHIMDVAEDFQYVAKQFFTTAFNAGSSESLLEYTAMIERLVEDAQAAVVGRGRAHGETLRDLSAPLGLSAERLRKKLSVPAIDRRLATRTRPIPRRPRRDAGERGLRSARQRLASALSHLQRRSPHSQDHLARQIGMSRSYVSRLLSGERPASWLHVKALATACDLDPERLRPLTDVAQGTTPTTGVEYDAAAYLRNYLFGLRLAVGDPSEAKLVNSTGITPAELRQAFSGPGISTWHITHQVALALSSHPEDIRPLWRAARAHTENGTGAGAAFPIRAESFG